MKVEDLREIFAIVAEARRDVDSETERYREALEELEAIAEDRADCDCAGDPPRYVPNDWMRALMIIRTALGKD